MKRTTYVPKYETFMKKCYAGEEISAAEHRPSHTLASILCWAARIDGTTFCHGTTFYLYGIPGIPEFLGKILFYFYFPDLLYAATAAA